MIMMVLCLKVVEDVFKSRYKEISRKTKKSYEIQENIEEKCMDAWYDHFRLYVRGWKD